MASNQAAFLDEKDARLRIASVDLAQPGPDEVVIQSKAWAINPVDWKIQDTAMFVQHWPIVLGTDIAGEIYEVGSNVTAFKKGDRVIAHAHGLVHQQPKYGSFQLYPVALAAATAQIPDSISFTDASVLPLAFDTALVGLSGPVEGNVGLGLPYPSLRPQPSGKTIVVWGASSSVGALAVQLAVASGVRVIAVASARNHAFVQEAGAVAAFDYNHASVVDDVVAALKHDGGEFAGVYDAISTPDSFQHVLPILEKAGGHHLASVLGAPDNAPRDLNVAKIFGVNPLTDAAWKEYITPALEQGTLKPIPQAYVVGKGLESLQRGLEENKKGVSAKKVVVEV